MAAPDAAMAAGRGGALELGAGDLAAIRGLLQELGLDGWLLIDFHDQNPVAGSILGIRGTTRRYFTLIPADGSEPVALIHAVDGALWREWPWRLLRYSGWRELASRLPELVGGRRRLALETSSSGALPTLDRVPAGAMALLRGVGVEPRSSGDLVTAFHARWRGDQLERHRRTAGVVGAVARGALERAAVGVREGVALTEGELSVWIRRALSERGVEVDVGCVVAVGRTASDPHYQPQGDGERIEAGELLLVDLWGKPTPDDVPADQTWMGYLGSSVPSRIQQVWEAVRDARDLALSFLSRRTSEGAEIRGFEVDDVCRTLIERRGFGEYFVHRTGHSIDRELHGSGPNLDNFETHDDRRLLVGVGFSVEPGVYIPGELGVRSEVNVHLGPAGPEVTTPDPQPEILTLLGG